ncbi:hypothetical protein HPC38_02285 [Pasteurellaceae bacterium HPA106]|uniref:hypothetical protein n=1 Tax=Spirabiliibacterium pneumoniae TaxID=221400 RepID=UPI001AADEFFC|nr:hypothetical protein [Spirabiliibacterium pneumoniae]MBE2895707.1 hypothetical protein [Spirabiliibacterium pneumoniae]
MSKKAVQYDNERKMHEVADKLDKGLIPLSQDGGNLIEMRNDGLYYGTVAPKELRDIYVSSVSGSDFSGDGSRSKPFKTLRKALSMVPSYLSYNVHLKAGETFIWTSDENNYAGPKDITNSAYVHINTYGDPVVEKEVKITPQAPQYNGRSSKRVKHAKLFLGVIQNEKTVNNKYGKPSFWPHFGSTIKFENIEFHTKGAVSIQGLRDRFYGSESAEGLGYWSGSFVYGDRGSAIFFNCRFIHDADEDASKVRFISESWNGAGVSAKFHRCYYEKTKGAINESAFDYGVFNIQTGASVNVNREVSGDDYLHSFGETLAEENLKSKFESVPKLLGGFVKNSKGDVQNCLLNFVPAS